MTVRAAWLLTGPPDGQTRTDTRLAPLGTMAPTGELTTRDGVIAGGAPLMASGAGAMQVQLGVGRALVQGSTAQGAYPVAVTVPETLTVTDGDAQNPRIDSIVLRVRDGLFDPNAQGQTTVSVELLVGAPAPSPSEPVLLGASLRLWSITVPAGASAGTGGINWNSALADRRRFTSSYGGIIPRGWGSSFSGAYDGQYRDVDGALQRWNAGTARWEQYPPDSGWTTLTLANGYANPGHGTVAAWRKLGSLVLLRGRLGPTKANTTIANAATIATLPQAIRPSGGKEFAWAAPRDQSSKGPAVTRVEITSAGLLRIYEGFDLPSWISLDGVTYATD
ncbi:hypothetical protein AB0I84_09165 [Streptomyces spectabilis]|uniref:hypothetical protein n=1 Tax=Streptomyces spectabilis TaxID=68270 RepID=UPI0033ECE4BC